MRGSRMPGPDREALQSFLGQPVADMVERKSVCWASAATFERRCAATGPLETHLLDHKLWDEAEKNSILVIRPDYLSLATRQAFASSLRVLCNCQMTCLSKYFSCRLVIFWLFFWVTGSVGSSGTSHRGSSLRWKESLDPGHPVIESSVMSPW